MHERTNKKGKQYRLVRGFVLGVATSDNRFCRNCYRDLALPANSNICNIRTKRGPILITLRVNVTGFAISNRAHRILINSNVTRIAPAFILLLISDTRQPRSVSHGHTRTTHVQTRRHLRRGRDVRRCCRDGVTLSHTVRHLRATTGCGHWALPSGEAPST